MGVSDEGRPIIGDETMKLLGSDEQFRREMEGAAENFRRVGAQLAEIGRELGPLTDEDDEGHTKGER